MAAWDKDKIFIRLLTPGTAVPDYNVHAVSFQPIDQVYGVGDIAGVQCSEDTSCWQPQYDLDTTRHYDVYVDATKIGRIISPDSNPDIGA